MFNLGRIFASLTRSILFWCYRHRIRGHLILWSKFWKIGELTGPKWVSKSLAFQAACVRVVFGSGIPQNSSRRWSVILTFCVRCFADQFTLHLLTLIVLLILFHYKTTTKAKFIFYTKKNGNLTWKAPRWVG